MLECVKMCRKVTENTVSRGPAQQGRSEKKKVDKCKLNDIDVQRESKSVR